MYFIHTYIRFFIYNKQLMFYLQKQKEKKRNNTFLKIEKQNFIYLFKKLKTVKNVYNRKKKWHN